MNSKVIITILILSLLGIFSSNFLWAEEGTTNGATLESLIREYKEHFDRSEEILKKKTDYMQVMYEKNLEVLKEESKKHERRLYYIQVLIGILAAVITVVTFLITIFTLINYFDLRRVYEVINMLKGENKSLQNALYNIKSNLDNIESRYSYLKSDLKETRDGTEPHILYIKLSYAVSLLNLPDFDRRKRGMEILTQVNDPQALPFLVKYLDDPNDEIVKICVLYGLKKFAKSMALKKKVVVPKLISLLDRPSAELQLACIVTIEEIAPNDSSYINKMRELFKKEELDPDVKKVIEENLRRKGML